jgi:hypothetical protein
MITNLTVLIVCFLGQISSLGARENNLLSPDRILNVNTSLFQTLLLSSYGSSTTL